MRSEREPGPLDHGFGGVYVCGKWSVGSGCDRPPLGANGHYTVKGIRITAYILWGNTTEYGF